MARNQHGARQGPWRVETVRGEPYQVAGRTLTPVARISSFGRARATIGSEQTGGWALGFARVRPVAFEEETGDGVRRIAIVDPTTRALRAFLAAGVAMAVFLGLVRWLARRLR